MAGPALNRLSKTANGTACLFLYALRPPPQPAPFAPYCKPHSLQPQRHIGMHHLILPAADSAMRHVFYWILDSDGPCITYTCPGDRTGQCLGDASSIGVPNVVATGGLCR